MEHVSGEYWIAFVTAGDGKEDPERSQLGLVSAYKGETEVSADGKVKRVGIALEDGMKGVLIWFVRDEV